MELTKLKGLRNDMEKCFRCSLCKMVPLPTANNPDFTDACPVSRFYHFHGYSGSGKQIMALSLLDGKIQPDQALAKITFACTACGYCDVACKFIMDAERHRVNMSLRELLVDEGQSPPQHKKMMENLKEYGHHDGKPKRSFGEWAKDLGLKNLPDQKAKVLLLAGTVQRNDDNAMKVAIRFAKILKHCGVDVGILGDAEPDCGVMQYWTGYRDEFTKTAADVTKLINGLGVDTVVTASGTTLGILRSKYPEYGSDIKPKVMHSTEFLAKLLDKGDLKLNKTLDYDVTYHDPCYLGRQSEPFIKWDGEEKITMGVMTYTDPPKPINYGVNGVFIEPRKLLSKAPGVKFTELYRIKEYAFSCGEGGGAPQAYPEMAKEAALHRIEEVKDVGAKVLVTACDFVEEHLSNVQKPLDDKEKIPVMDIVDVVFESAGLKD